MADDLLSRDDLFHLREPQLPPLCGSVLLAKPTMPDPFFARSVILMCHHGDDGSFGLMMNRPLSQELGEFHDGSVPELLPFAHVPVWMGGPVDPSTLCVVHTLPPEVVAGSEELQPGLYLGGDMSQLAAVVQRHWGGTVDARQVRFVLCYSGWAAGQLQDELERDDWAVVDGVGADVLLGDDPATMWERCVRLLPPRYHLWLNVPQDVSCN